MPNFFHWSSTGGNLLALGLAAATVAPLTISSVVLAQNTAPYTVAATNFSDVSADFWARPFIEALAERNVISGFPDGSFKPSQAVSRAEFATMIQKAFNQQPVRQLSASGFTDVSANFWAASAIQEAYETGFLTGYPGNVFLPNQQIPKVQAIVALTNGLGLQATDSATGVVNTYFTDASAIPNYAVNDVAAATQANVVVNYPNVRQLNPLEPLTRAEAAAILYQALVKQGQAQPLASNVTAAEYIVGRTASNAQTGNDIVSVAASSNSFTTLTSLLKTAGLADILQQPGPYTVFAPTDQAFAALPAGTIQQLQQPQNRPLLIQILRYHVVPGQLTANQLSSGELKTVESAPVNIKVDTATNQVAVNEARVVQSDIQASNGVIHAINEVLIPPNLTSQQPQGETNQAQAPTNEIKPGRATRGGSSYIGAAGNIGLGGDTALSESNFAVISKIGLTRTLSVRPSVVFGNDTVFLVPLTYDFAPRSVEPGVVQQLSVSPYIGAGVALEASDDTDIGLLLTGGVDVPLGNRFTLTGAVNAAFVDQTDVGLLLGVGYNF
ncbi:secreted/surface protein with fasciclin-like repeats [Nostoc sp. PCC 7524]|uniref:fasciclin domain-containing protein n=1 Tax=Nostoc sp. (strain ATCC 29411 / PCC 7524) TaxID=28072 RepID=UPI00029F19AA|nr:fasciclin domain-containing protein [Nostoc sp. PCC 7524]AFY48532.1 secreted/surface protein with fasciclin-like repeats [Nostoc sp. PCC 7524]